MNAGKRIKSNRRPTRRRFHNQFQPGSGRSGLPLAPHDDLTDRLLKAQRLADDERYGEALALAMPLAGQITVADRERHLFSCRLLAFTLSQSGRFDEARRYGEEGAKVCPDGLDFSFVLTVNAARQRRYDEALRHGRRYLDRWTKIQKASTNGAEWDRTFDRRYQVLNAYAVALLEESRPDEAEAAWREAIALCPGFDSSYLNLARLLFRQGKTAEAGQVVQAGLRAAPDSMDLRQLAAADTSRATVSVCMIVKNEETLLPRCLKSVRDLADEIIVVDTGSTDRTREIARDFGGIVYEYPWQGDFSAARNESLRHATKNWILVIDADEELPAEETAALRFFIDQPDIRIISLSIYNKSLETGRISSFLPSMRLFRRNLDLRYYGIVHNRLDVPSDVPITRCQAKIYHYGYDLSREALEKKKARTMALLEQQLAANPDDVYANFNMAQLLRGFREANNETVNRRIIEHAGRVIRHPESRTQSYHGQRLMSLHQMATALYALNQYDEAERYCQEALAAKPGYLDPMLTLGHIHLASGRLDKAKTFYHQYLEARATYRADDETDNIILLHLDGLHVAWYGLGLIAEKEKATAEGIACYRNVLEAQTPYLDTYLRLGRLSLDTRDSVAAEEMFRKEVERDDRSAWAWFGLAEALAMQGREDLTVDYFRKAADLAPDNPHMLFRLGKTRLRLGDTAGGIPDLQKAAEAGDSDTSLLFQTADCLFAGGAFDFAARLYQKVLERLPERTEARLNLGNCLFKTGDMPAARALYKQVIQRRPDYLLAWRNLGLAEARLGHIGEALSTLAHYHELNPRDFQIDLLAGDLCASQGDEVEAIRWYERFLQLRPQDEVGILRLAESYMRQGFVEAAALGFRKALALNPGCPQARDRLAEVEALAGPVSS
jgi:tetratricopeptide (TPR) repeat protein